MMCGPARRRNANAACTLASAARARHFRAMQSHELLREVFQTTSAKQIAADLNLSLSLIYKWAEPPDNASGSGASNPLDRIDALLHSTHDARLVHWICERAGGFFIRNPKTHNPHPDFLIPATNEIIQEFADLMAVIASAAADNHISADEAKKIRARWEDLKTVTETFVHCCEQGNFRPLKEKPPGLGGVHPPTS
jgi:transposase